MPLAVQSQFGQRRRRASSRARRLLPLDRVDQLRVAVGADVQILDLGRRTPSLVERDLRRAVLGLLPEVDDLDRLPAREHDPLDEVRLFARGFHAHSSLTPVSAPHGRNLNSVAIRLGRSVVLSDRTIRAEIEAGRIVIEPFDETLIQPSSVDVRVDRALPRLPQRALPVHRRAPADGGPDRARSRSPSDEPFILHPGEFVLGQTLERVTLPDDLVARLEGKSSLGRLGLLIHSTAGFVDAGF